MVFKLIPGLFGLVLLLSSSLVSLADDRADALDVVSGAIDRTLTSLRADRDRAQTDPDFVLTVIRREVLPAIDVEGMVRLILARHWRDGTEEQQARLVAAFRETMLNTYGRQLGGYLDQEVILVPRRSRQDDRMAVVYTEIVLGGGQPNLAVQYRLRPVEGDWRIFDVEAEGLSLVTNFRNAFNTEINRNGLERLIERLEAGDRSLMDEVVGPVSGRSVPDAARRPYG
jgi:phospholipid transport system substrate-binding protein